MIDKSAISIRYPDGADAPFVTYKAKGQIADQMVKVAKEKGIPVFCDKETTAILSMVDIGNYIPEQTYQVISGIFAFIKMVQSDAKIKK
jgi:type III secretion system FlhB-like substrate exporter